MYAAISNSGMFVLICNHVKRWNWISNQVNGFLRQKQCWVTFSQNVLKIKVFFCDIGESNAENVGLKPMFKYLPPPEGSTFTCVG